MSARDVLYDFLSFNSRFFALSFQSKFFLSSGHNWSSDANLTFDSQQPQKILIVHILQIYCFLDLDLF
jgi:hypothetical protein